MWARSPSKLFALCARALRSNRYISTHALPFEIRSNRRALSTLESALKSKIVIRRFKLIWIVIGRPSLSLSRRFQRQPPIYRNYYVYLSYSLNSNSRTAGFHSDFCRTTISYLRACTATRRSLNEWRGRSTLSNSIYRDAQDRRDIFESG